jgi:8-oxo-dGTP pyrophosphatase MutT (NUDIX family)
VDILRGLPCYEKKNDNRSVYQRELQNSCKAVPEERRMYQYAEAIVNLCYNYACEISICNISKHYNRLDGDATFEKDFYARLAQDWNDAKNADNRYLTEETNVFDAFAELDQIPNFEEAVRMTEYVDYKKEEDREAVARYEFEMQEQRSRQKRQVLSAIGRRVGVSLICVLVACSLEVFSQYIQDMFDAVVNFDTIYWGVIETILFLAVSEAVTTWLAARFPWLLSLSDALGGLGVLGRDIRCILFGRAATYSHDSNEAGSDFQERYSSGVAIDYVRSGALKKYIKYRKDPANKPLFAKAELYPIAEVDNADVVRELARQEELFHWQFGITYQSKYNQMVVDPIVAGNGRYYPYERVVPTAGNGVVIVVKCCGNFLLLRQFRHAIRAEQYSFPRGYAEPNTAPEENVKIEISEELGAGVKEGPYLLGRIETDSGLTSSRVSVYLVEIEGYVTQTGYEGIREVVELSQEQLEKKIADGEISDGFTLAAFQIYKEKRRSL